VNLNGKKCSAFASCDSCGDEISNQSKNILSHEWDSAFDIGWTTFPRKVQPLPKMHAQIACYISHPYKDTQG
jgi:hypothetical protein